MSTFTSDSPASTRPPCAAPGALPGCGLRRREDIIVTYAKLAVKSGFVLLAPEDALERHGRDVSLEQLPGETSTGLPDEISQAWDTWPWAGTRTGLETVFTQLGYPSAVLLTAQEWGVPLASTLWARWWLLIAPTDHGFPG